MKITNSFPVEKIQGKDRHSGKSYYYSKGSNIMQGSPNVPDIPANMVQYRVLWQSLAAVWSNLDPEYQRAWYNAVGLAFAAGLEGARNMSGFQFFMRNNFPMWATFSTYQSEPPTIFPIMIFKPLRFECVIDKEDIYYVLVLSYIPNTLATGYPWGLILKLTPPWISNAKRLNLLNSFGGAYANGFCQSIMFDEEYGQGTCYAQMPNPVSEYDADYFSTVRITPISSDSGSYDTRETLVLDSVVCNVRLNFSE
jgi:hypothetical protein